MVFQDPGRGFYYLCLHLMTLEFLNTAKKKIRIYSLILGSRNYCCSQVAIRLNSWLQGIVVYLLVSSVSIPAEPGCNRFPVKGDVWQEGTTSVLGIDY